MARSPRGGWESLGIDPIPLKTCNWNCVYCQLGRSTPLVNERKNYYVPEAILAEVQAVLAAHRPGDIDWITFVGSGEPTLHASIGPLIRQVKTLTDLPVAVITNGSLLYLPEVRQELSAADAVLPTLDAGNAHLYRKINRPWPRLTFERLLGWADGISASVSWQAVDRGHAGQRPERHRRCLARYRDRFAEHRTRSGAYRPPTRPPAEPWVEPPDRLG